MSRSKKETISRRDFIKVTSVMAGSALLSACSGILAPEPTLTPSPTFTKTSTPTRTPEPTSTSTPEPSPTPEPKRWTAEVHVNGQVFEMVLPHTNLDGREVFDFTLEKMPLIPDIKYLRYWHEALRSVTLRDGSKLIQPFPSDVAIPDWTLPQPDHPKAFQPLLANFERSDKTKYPVRLISGLGWKIIAPGSDLVIPGITAQIYHPNTPTHDILVTGLGDPTEYKRKSAGLINGGSFPVPRLGIPDDIAKGGPNVSNSYAHYTAFLLTRVNAWDGPGYTQAMLDWHTNNFPPDFFTHSPYLQLLGTL